MANDELLCSGSESVVEVELLAGQYPTYAALKRCESKLVVEEIEFHCGLDTRQVRNPDRTMMTLTCRLMDEPIKITNCQSPAPAERSWDISARSAVLPKIFEHD